MIEWNTTPWMRSILPHDTAIKLSKAGVHVHSESGPCLGKIHEHPALVKQWNDQIGWFMDSKDYHELIGWIRRRAGRVRGEYFPRTHNTGSAP